MSFQSYAPQLPLELDENSRFFMISDSLANAKQNLKMLILTSPGEKLMDPQFGVGIYRYLFEPASGFVTTVANKVYSIDDFQTIITDLIKSQTYKYLNNITIQDIEVEVGNNSLNITIQYNYSNFISDTLIITLSS